MFGKHICLWSRCWGRRFTGDKVFVGLQCNQIPAAKWLLQPSWLLAPMTALLLLMRTSCEGGVSWMCMHLFLRVWVTVWVWGSAPSLHWYRLKNSVRYRSVSRLSKRSLWVYRTGERNLITTKWWYYCYGRRGFLKSYVSQRNASV